jgi:hypothetical protein
MVKERPKKKELDTAKKKSHHFAHQRKMSSPQHKTIYRIGTN